MEKTAEKEKVLRTDSEERKHAPLAAQNPKESTDKPDRPGDWQAQEARHLGLKQTDLVPITDDDIRKAREQELKRFAHVELSNDPMDPEFVSLIDGYAKKVEEKRTKEKAERKSAVLPRASAIGEP